MKPTTHHLGRRIAAYAAHSDVACGLVIAAGVATRDRMPHTASRTRQIATDLGYDNLAESPNILILGMVTDQVIADLRHLADVWETNLRLEREAKAVVATVMSPSYANAIYPGTTADFQ